MAKSTRGKKLDAIKHKPSGGTKRKKGTTTVKPFKQGKRYGIKATRTF